MNIDLAVVARDLRLPPEKIERSVQLLDQGNTIPFITRFRKDQTGGLNEEQLLAIKQRVTSLRSLAERKAFVLKSIQSQSKLTDELATEIEKTTTARRLEDLYHPFKAKKQSRAQTARHQGLEPLAHEILEGTNADVDMSAQATHYVRVDKGLTSVDDVIKGVGDLLAERFSEDSSLRTKLRKILWDSGSLVSQPSTPQGGSTVTKQTTKKTPPPSPPADLGDDAHPTKSKTPAVSATLTDSAVESIPATPTEGLAPTPAAALTEQPSATQTPTPQQPAADPSIAQTPASEKSTRDVAQTSSPPAQPIDTAVSSPDQNTTQPTAQPTEPSAAEPTDGAGSPVPDATDDSSPDKSTFKMASAGSDPEDQSQPTSSSPQHQPLKPTQPAQTPPTTISDPDAPSPVVADPAEASKTANDSGDTSGVHGDTQTPATSAAATIPAEPSAATPGPSVDSHATAATADAPKVSSPSSPAAKPKKKKRKKKKKKDDSAFKDYYDFKQSLKSLPNHQILAINRGERANRLKVKIAYDEKQMVDVAAEHLIPADHPFRSFLEKCVHDALNRLIIPSLEREIRRELTEKSEKHAVDVFAANLKNLLLTPPLRSRRVMAIDPGFKSGCSVAILDNQGQCLASDHVFVVGNKQRRDESRQKVATLVKDHHIDMIAIGNGVGCRETEQMVSDAIAEFLTDHPVRYIIVNEAGASIYSTSEVGREELPDHTPAVRSAISIGRRLQNPISELVKISPANIGVGMYQHDVKAKHLSESLDEVVQFCVNRVGVDVNSASPSLLKFVSGMNALTARRLYEYRRENGGIKNRQQLKEVSGLGEATFVQAAGFLRISDGDNPLDSTSIHPESYPIAEEIIQRADATPEELFPPRQPPTPVPKASTTPPPTVAANPVAANPVAAVPGSLETSSPDTSETDGLPDQSNPTATAALTPVAVAVASDEEPIAPQPQSTPPINDATAAPPTAGETPTDPPVDPPTAVAQPVPTPSTSVATGDDREKSKRRKEIIERIAALDLDAIASEKQVGKMLMTDLVRAIKKPLWDPRDKISKPISRRGILKADDLKPEMQLEAQVVNVVDFGVFVDIGLGESCLVHVSQLSTRYISDPQMVYAVGDILKVWVSEIDAQRRRVKLTAIRPGTKKESSRGRRRNDSKRDGTKPPRADGKPAHARPAHARPKFERKKTERRPPAKPKPVIPITDEMLKGDAPMRSFSDLLQFKKKSPDDQKKNGES